MIGEWALSSSNNHLFARTTKIPEEPKVPNKMWRDLRWGYLDTNKWEVLFYAVSLPPSPGMCCLSGGHMYNVDVTPVPIMWDLAIVFAWAHDKRSVLFSETLARPSLFTNALRTSSSKARSLSIIHYSTMHAWLLERGELSVRVIVYFSARRSSSLWLYMIAYIIIFCIQVDCT